MGQKTHPYGFRLVYNKSWKSRWYADKDYARLLHEDLDLTVRRDLREHAGPRDVREDPLRRLLPAEDVERALITNTLRDVGGNRERASQLLGISTRTLYRKIKEYGQSQPLEQAEDAESAR